ncbi:hypothetical protein [Streptomyces sp. WP-1]|uniref:hypothetical protein n=1 Tax=Streptomyces sp. WP-1 TaxID=3041497 RepID=UPI0026476F7F|nr:hypothetical protein [Streptomyces sp. WP-1]WKE71636.1 hypothetical protein QHG49_22770 [Streptomyces sp. WP-1]
MPNASARPAGARTPRGAVTGLLRHRAVRTAVLALLLAVLPASLAAAPVPKAGDALTAFHNPSPTTDIPLCC